MIYTEIYSVLFDVIFQSLFPNQVHMLLVFWPQVPWIFFSTILAFYFWFLCTNNCLCVCHLKSLMNSIVGLYLSLAIRNGNPTFRDNKTKCSKISIAVVKKTNIVGAFLSLKCFYTFLSWVLPYQYSYLRVCCSPLHKSMLF